MTTEFVGYQCWDESRISVVINKEAISVDRATFMATHAPLNNIRYLSMPRQIKGASETELLEELRTRAGNDQHTFAVVQGIPGTGKSHLIRWLKERYVTNNQETGGSDVILLIERANSSLRSTLLQIIESNVFDNSRFSEQIDRLRSATEQLSKKGLADTVLNNLQVATSEVPLKESEQPPGRIRRNIEKFLLDYLIREELKKEGGPIERIVRFLSGQGKTGLVDDELPTFQAPDFDFQIDFLRGIKNQPDGYIEAKKLAESLNLKPKLREELATYLNRLLAFAVGRTTALSADELKQIFNDLRRELRQQGRQLALFIEDIAVFTGLDAGLVDVLATQHTGEGNREFCRMLSVVGITDNYYHDHFPDNMKQRITHRLTLNASNQGQLESDLLKAPKAVADMVARYLNAIRLDREALNSWQQNGAQLDQLPNRCQDCSFKSTCHAAFGYVQVGESEEDDALEIGLYPFNQQSLWTMYSRINKIARTPRTLLNNVIEYVLQSHGWQISQNQFPPVARDLGSDFTPPTLAKPAQRSLLTSQSGSPNTANRVESLVLFWGNRTIDVTTDIDGQPLVGSLRKEVFIAFGLPFINGEGVATPPIPAQPPLTTPTPPSPTPPPSTIPQPQPPPQQQPQPENPLTLDIERWRTGSQLQYYEKLATGLADLAGSFIDWEAYTIPAALADERLKQARFFIEGQAGRVGRTYRLEFKRSDELALVFHALVNLQDNIQVLEPGKVGSHIATLSRWMRKQEPRIVEFVRQPNFGADPSVSLAELTLQNNLLITCLDNGLDSDQTTSQNLYFKLVEADPKVRSTPWDMSVTRAEETHSNVWARSMKGLSRYVDESRRLLFPLFNCPQGRSKDLRFIDAATTLDLLDRFTQQRWELKSLKIKPEGDLWTLTNDIYQVLKPYFAEALNQDRQLLSNYHKRLKAIVGKNSPEEILQATDEMLKALLDHQIPFIFEEQPELTAAKLQECLDNLQIIPAKEEIVQLALWLSGAGQLVRDTKEYLDYLEGFYKLAENQEKQLAKKIQVLQDGAGGTPLDTKVVNEYEKIRELLTQILEDSTSEEKAK